MSTRFEIKPFEELTTKELYDILHLRDIVFVYGQKITAVPEIDGEDPKCAHVLFYKDDVVVGTARIFHQNSPMGVGRIAIHNDLQGTGLGTVMMEHLQVWIGERPAYMHAQAYLENWYARLGWVRSGENFMEAEIDHVPMDWLVG